ncbi:MAG TPA: hypothetical protein VHG32_06125 [Thermoanaerobaculia bacterium]|jgi:hypothetical protein|nr:hypothetical protein [Thermoanaerobaculia bacterium]
MNTLKVLSLFALAACAAVWASAAESGRPASLLRARLSARASYVLGEAIRVELTLENVSSVPVSVLNWDTPFDRAGAMGGHAFRVRRDGVEVRYRGALAKRGDPGIENYMRIEPGSSATAIADLATAYDLSQPGTYEVEFIGHLFDVVPKAERLPHRRDEMHGATVPAGPVTFRVIRADGHRK